MTVMQESREQLPVMRRLRLPLAAQLQQLLLDMVNSAAALFSHYLVKGQCLKIHLAGTNLSPVEMMTVTDN
jgi:hypothetical protein